MPVIYQHRIYREDLRKNPDVLYLFGDNLARAGFGGQAKEMRDEPNAVGVATKKWPDNAPRSFFTDDEFMENVKVITRDLRRARAHIKAGGIVVIPSDGLGTGLSRLPEVAPRTAQVLDEMLNLLSDPD